MSTIELRHLITKYLSHIDDVSFLKALKTIIESKAAEGIYHLSPEQTERVDLGRDQLSNGQTIPQEELQIEIDQWLGSK
jgi:hypothetical protein